MTPWPVSLAEARMLIAKTQTVPRFTDFDSQAYETGKPVLMAAVMECTSVPRYALQFAYCVEVRDDDEFYRRRKYLTLEERRKIVEELRRTGEVDHADALEAETDRLLAAGKLAMTDDKPGPTAA